jgi:hypothetical protein
LIDESLKVVARLLVDSAVLLKPDFVIILAQAGQESQAGLKFK